MSNEPYRQGPDPAPIILTVGLRLSGAGLFLLFLRFYHVRAGAFGLHELFDIRWKFSARARELTTLPAPITRPLYRALGVFLPSDNKQILVPKHGDRPTIGRCSCFCGID